jgi:hypothetical protein
VPHRVVRAVAVGAVMLLSLLMLPASSWAGGPGKWTKLATVDNNTDTFGMLRTGDGKLHIAWLAKKAGNGTYSYDTGAISQAGKFLGASPALSGWTYLEPDPQLVRDGSGLRLIFEGNKGSSGCYFDASVFTATSTNGTAWNLVTGSMDQHTAGVGNLAATVESDGTTPVATFAGGNLFHVGVDPNCPASSPDGTITPTPGSAQGNPAIVTDSHGSVWVGWFQEFKKQAYWVNPILPTQAGPVEAPDSATHIQPFQNNQPNQPVALAARVGGGVYMAYCVASASQPCSHIDLWKVGSAKPLVVPGSANTTGAHVTVAAGPKGHMWVAWYNAAKKVIHAVRTNTTATRFGVNRTIKAPSKSFNFTDIQGQGSSGRLDVLVDDRLSTAGLPIDLFHTQILPGLSLNASPHTFSHKKAATVKFTVRDAGQAVSGAKVACLGKHGQTTASGTVKLHFGKGRAVGKHVCTATKAGYAPGKTTLKVK